MSVIKKNIDVYKAQYYGRAERLAAHDELGEARERLTAGISAPATAEVAFLENRVKTIDAPYVAAAATVEARRAKQNEAITAQEAALAELEEALWEMHGDASRTKEYIELRQKYVEGIVALRAVQYPRRFVLQQDHAFASSYMNMRADPDAGFQKGAPIYIVKQLPDVRDMIVGDVREHAVVGGPAVAAPAVAGPAAPEEPAAVPAKKRKVIKLIR